MNLFGEKKETKGMGGITAPTQDLYGRWNGSETGMFKKATKQIIFPGVTKREADRLEKVRKYVEDATGEECTLPQHVIEDVYSMYVNGEFKRTDVTSSNNIKQKIIDKVYNSLTKTVTKDSALFAQMVTNELALYMQKVQRVIQEEQKKQQQQNDPNGGDGPAGDCPLGSGMDQNLPPEDGFDGNGDDPNSDPGDKDRQSDGDENGQAAGDGTEQKGPGDLSDEAIDKIIDDHEKDLDKALKDASDKMEDLENKIGKENLQDLANSEPDFMENMENIKDALKRVAINKQSIKEVLVKILNESNNYFSKNFDTVEESLFEAEELEDLFGLEYLHPVFKNAEIMSAGNATKRYKGKIDLYLDCSGSMDSSRNFAGTSIRMIDLVKGIAMVLYRMDMIEKLYFFDSNIYEIENINEYTILAFDQSGGTNFNRVVEQCIDNKRNSVVITDGQDSVEQYVPNVFWVGVAGTTFGGGGYHYGGGGAFEKYRERRQCVTYDHDSAAGTFKYCTV